MKNKRIVRTGPRRPVRTFRILSGALAAIAFATAAPVAPAAAQTLVPVSAAAAAAPGISDFYAGRDNRPLWFSKSGRQVELLLGILQSAELDGLNTDRYKLRSLERAVTVARTGSPKSVRRADRMLSQALVDYVRDVRRPAGSSIIYVDPELKPAPPSPRAILEAASEAPSLERYVSEMGWMHPIYGQLRTALTRDALSPERRKLVQLNLQRARELPAGNGRYIVVNAAEQRLSMYENRAVADSMRVVVGKPVYPTPMMTAYVRFANLNPYWFVPPDLAAERIAPNVLRQGVKYLVRQGYQVVSDFVDEPRIYDPSIIDWQAVADGRQKVLIRQLPGPHNSMGRIKFMFPNEQGVYLHDNPERELFEQAARLYSGGCVRLEAAWRLSRWLFGRDLDWKGAGAEEKIPLAKPVPVYITYLTAVPDGSTIAYLEDVYGRDRARLVQRSDGAPVAASH